jgi:hypothetical protein
MGNMERREGKSRQLVGGAYGRVSSVSAPERVPRLGRDLRYDLPRLRESLEVEDKVN